MLCLVPGIYYYYYSSTVPEYILVPGYYFITCIVLAQKVRQKSPSQTHFTPSLSLSLSLSKHHAQLSLCHNTHLTLSSSASSPFFFTYWRFLYDLNKCNSRFFRRVLFQPFDCLWRHIYATLTLYRLSFCS